MSKTVALAVVTGVVALIVTHNFRSVTSPVVTIKDGKLQGRIGSSRDGKEYFEYLSIPFAEPPVGNLRYEPPLPLKKPWGGVRQTTNYPPLCLQADPMIRGTILGKEDCLFLNVFTHETEGKRPVMVFLHGGGFTHGGSSVYHPQFFMDEDIVLVTVNYRLGPLGFMNLEDGLIRGNMGLKDQTLALKWVQNNIGKFGGDPEKVTLFGQSAGAGAVEYHMISPLSKGLFHRAILHSGAFTCPWAFRHEPKHIAMEFIKNTKCYDVKEETLVQCLKQIDAVDLVKQSLRLMDPTNPFLLFTPTIETGVKEDTFLKENPRKLLEAGKLVNNVPVIFGVTSGEGAFRTARIEAMSETIPKIDKDWEDLAAGLLFFEDKYVTAEATKKLRSQYFGSSSFTENIHMFKKNFSRMASDGMFYEPVQSAAMLHVKHGAPTYMYFYDYDSSVLPSIYSFFRAVRIDDWIYADLKLAYASLVDVAKKKWFKTQGPHEFGLAWASFRGATHADDLLMLWNMEGWTAKLAGPDAQFSKAFVKAMVDFAKHKESLEFDGIHWPSIEEGVIPRSYMYISKEAKVITEPFTESVHFWKTLNVHE